MKYIVIALAVLLSGCAADLSKKCIVVQKKETQVNTILIRNLSQDANDGTWITVTAEEFNHLNVGDEYKGGVK